MSNGISELNFGALAAERERDFLSTNFIDSGAYHAIKGGGKIILLGHRGTGKTAILTVMAEENLEKGNIVIELSPEDYAYELLSETLPREGAGAWHKYGAYAAAWKYLLYVLSMKHIVKAKSGFKTGPAKRIYHYVRDHHKNIDLNPIGALISYLKRLEGVKIGKFEASIKAKELHSLYKLEEIKNLLGDLNKVCERQNVFIIIDELDRGWDASEDAIAFVAGLFQASTSVSLIGQKKASKK